MNWKYLLKDLQLHAMGETEPAVWVMINFSISLRVQYNILCTNNLGEMNAQGQQFHLLSFPPLSQLLRTTRAWKMVNFLISSGYSRIFLSIGLSEFSIEANCMRNLRGSWPRHIASFRDPQLSFQLLCNQGYQLVVKQPIQFNSEMCKTQHLITSISTSSSSIGVGITSQVSLNLYK